MKLDSKYFDTIRVKRKGAGGRKATAEPECAWEGCGEPGAHKAPMGRDYEGQYLHFCVDHVRQYNKSYNYFSGLNDAAIQRYLKDAMIGHRPTWAMGHNGSAPSSAPTGRGRRWNARTRDTFNIFGENEEAERRAAAAAGSNPWSRRRCRPSILNTARLAT